MIRKLYVVRFNLKPKNDRMLFSPYFHAGTYTEQPVYSYKISKEGTNILIRRSRHLC